MVSGSTVRHCLEPMKSGSTGSSSLLMAMEHQMTPGSWETRRAECYQTGLLTPEVRGCSAEERRRWGISQKMVLLVSMPTSCSLRWLKVRSSFQSRVVKASPWGHSRPPQKVRSCSARRCHSKPGSTPPPSYSGLLQLTLQSSRLVCLSRCSVALS